VIRFFETSALVKRYVEEPGSAMVRGALRASLRTINPPALHFCFEA